MALIICEDCGKEFSTDAKQCPHCGAKKVVKKIGPSAGVVLIVLFAIGVIGNVMGKGNGSSPIVTDMDIAPQMCQEFVKESLHDPDSAQFDPSAKYFVEREKNGVFYVQVTGRARNGFNALRKLLVECKVKRVGPDKWMVMKLKEIR